LCTSNVVFNVTATDNCGVDSIASVPSSGSSFPVGATMVTSTATDVNGNTSACSFTVTVVDDQKPVIPCPADITGQAGQGLCTSNVVFNVTATDNCGVDSIASVPYSGSAFPVGATVVTSTATDVNGNTSTCSFTVTVVDDQKPVIHCPADIIVKAAEGLCTSNVVFNITATDNCGMASLVSVPASGSPFPVGTTRVTSTATHVSGKTGNCRDTV